MSRQGELNEQCGSTLMIISLAGGLPPGCQIREVRQGSLRSMRSN